jgi:hypothetical protein
LSVETTLKAAMADKATWMAVGVCGKVLVLNSLREVLPFRQEVDKILVLQTKLNCSWLA